MGILRVPGPPAYGFGSFIAADLLLDAFPGALFAYSFRKLRKAYAGSAVRIRRSSDSTEQDIGFVGNAFDAASAASFIGGGSGFLSQWYDQSGNGYDVVQANTLLQPGYVAAGLNSKPSGNYTYAGGGTGVFLKKASADLKGVSSLTSYIVLTHSSNAFTTGRALSMQSTNQAADYDNAFSAISVIAFNDGIETLCSSFGSTLTSIALNTPYRIISIFNPTTTEMYINSVSTGAPQTITGTMRLGGDSSGLCSIGVSLSNGWDGYICEVVAYPKVDAADRVRIDANQAGAWGF